MPRLSTVDQAFFLLETTERPMNIGALFVLVPPKGGRGGFADRLVRTMLKRPVGPPFSYRLKPGPLPGLLGLDEDPHMDPAPQVHRHRLPTGTDLQALFERLCRIHVVPLRRDAPLWELHVFTGLPGGRVALHFKTHHGLIDGIGFIKALDTMVSPSAPASARRPRAIWEGLRHVPPPAAPAVQGLEGMLHTANDVRRTASDLLRLVWHQGLRDLGLGRGLTAPFVTTPNVLKAEPSPNRVLAHCVLSLPQVRAIARAGNAKVNDVMLTLIDMSMHRYLHEHGTIPERPLVADMPVALEDHGRAGNRITILQVPMGRPGAAPAQRLEDVMQETSQVKQEMRTLAGSALTLYSIVQHSLASTIESLGLSELPMLANAVISNPAGFEQRMYFNGAEVELALPISVVAHHQVLNITITTYVDELHVTFIALREAIPDLRRLAEYTAAAVIELEADLARRPRRRTKARPRKPTARQAETKRARKPAARRSPRRSPVR
jgi:diacylglycerol O-acyltransferase / wax synthase